MVRKDYVYIARVINDERENSTSAEVQGTLDSVAERIADYIEENDAGFDRPRFLKAAGAA